MWRAQSAGFYGHGNYDIRPVPSGRGPRLTALRPSLVSSFGEAPRYPPMAPDPVEPRQRYRPYLGATATFLLILAAVLAGGCSQTAPDSKGSVVEEIVGLVTAVEARSFDEVESLTVEDSSGTSWVFEDVAAIEFTPSHLRQHMTLGQPIKVTFRRAGGKLVIDGIGD